MAAPIENATVDKKFMKKLHKHRHSLMTKEKIKFEDNPTKILCIGNGGLDNGVTCEEMVQLFKVYGTKVDIIMLPQKSYSFVCFTSVDDAKLAYESLNGYRLGCSERRKAEVVFYILFVSEAPASVAPSTMLPPGLILLEDFITEEYAQEILKSVVWTEDTYSGSKQELKHRRVKHYGYEFKYSINNVDPEDPLPEGILAVYQPLIEQLLATGHVSHRPDQLTVNQYQPGQGIPPHVDTPSAFEDGLTSLSIGSQVLMEFRHPDGQHRSVLLPHRSALIMTGESRYTWSHGITPRKSDIVPSPEGGLTLSHRGLRTSFTFRKITGVKPGQETDKPDIPATDSAAASLEKLHVHQVYEKIADNFSGTRHTPWPRIADFLRQQPPGSFLADIGCGNGKYLGINKHIYEVGSDRSFNLATIVKERGFPVFVGDVLAVPLRPESFDVCLCIAVIHHLSTHERRLRAVQEMLKILCKGGKCLIYVWAIEQELNKVKSKYLKGSKGQQGSYANEDSQETNIADGGGEGTSKCDQNCDKHREVGDHCCENVGTKDIKNVTDIESRMKKNVDNGNCEDNKRECLQSETDIPARLEIHVNRTPFKQQDMLVPWQLKKGSDSKEANTFHRYYHVFKKGEIEKLCVDAGGCKVIESYYDQGNWAVVLEKL